MSAPIKPVSLADLLHRNWDNWDLAEMARRLKALDELIGSAVVDYGLDDDISTQHPTLTTVVKKARVLLNGGEVPKS